MACCLMVWSLFILIEVTVTTLHSQKTVGDGGKETTLPSIPADVRRTVNSQSKVSGKRQADFEGYKGVLY